MKNENQTVSKKIAAELKKIGITNRQVSCKERSGYTSSSTTIKIKAPVDVKKVKEIAEKFKKVDICPASGEILGGGNHFVFVEFDSAFIKETAKIFLPLVEKAAKELESEEKGTLVPVGDFEELYLASAGNNAWTLRGAGDFTNYFSLGSIAEALAKKSF